MSEFLAYRIPDQAIKKMSGQFELIDQENMPKNCFILSNFNQNKQYIFVPSEQDFEKTFETHFTSEEFIANYYALTTKIVHCSSFTKHRI